MPTPQLEQRTVYDWIEEPLEEVDSTSRRAMLANAMVSAPTEGIMHRFIDTHPYHHFAFWCDRQAVNRERYIWDLARAARTKVAREYMEKYEAERLIEEINEVYDEEMEQEDKEFARRTRGYYRRLLSTED